MGHEFDEEAFQKWIVDALSEKDGDGVGYDGYERYDVVYKKDEPVTEGKIRYLLHSALCPDEIVEFVKKTQPEEWSQLAASVASNPEQRLVNGVKHRLDDVGTLSTLRNSITVDGIDFDLCYFPSTDDESEDKRWKDNRFVVIKELQYDEKQNENHRNRLDLGLFLNGIPISTVELKNLGTGQNVADGIEQYENTRRPEAAIFRFPYRSMIQFVVDKRRVFMTTHLDGVHTRWFPFNRNFDKVEGNSGKDDDSYRTEYLWNDVWRPRAFLELIQFFMLLQPPDDTKPDATAKDILESSTQFFPRFHQRRAVLDMLETCREKGVGQKFLIQHSTGSGKSLTIGWLAHRLASLYRDQKQFYDKVIVVSDRRVIFRQLRDLVRSLTSESVKDPGTVVYSVDGGKKNLIEALNGPYRIIVSTVHAFWHVRKKIDDMENRRYAILIDEAHRSQDGELNKYMRKKLGANGSLLDEMGQSEALNLAMFAFTATPTDKTKQRFGEKVSDKKWRSHDLYEMYQARHEGFIVDVLRCYQPWKQKALAVAKADKDLKIQVGKVGVMEVLAEDESMVERKAKVIVDHLLGLVVDSLGGRAKSMLICTSKAAAFRYRRAVLKILEEKGRKDIGVLVAFSGSYKLVLPGEGKEQVFTEAGLNGKDDEDRNIEGDLIAQSLRHNNHLLIAVDKFQTGFDEPLLLAMYVDKSLRGINAVQTLSRLNRKYDGKGKGDEFGFKDKDGVDPFVIDFFNQPDEILEAFKRFDKEAIQKTFVPSGFILELMARIDEYQLVTHEEKDIIWELWWEKKKNTDPKFTEIFSLAIDRFYELSDDSDRWRVRAFIRRFLRLFASAYEIVTEGLSPEKLIEIDKRVLIWRKLLVEFNSWSPGYNQDEKPAVHLKPGHVEFSNKALEELEEAELTIDDDGESPDPRALTITEPKKRIENTLGELVEQFNKKFAGVIEVTKEQAQVLNTVVSETAQALGSQKIVNISEWRTRFSEGFVSEMIEDTKLPKKLKDYIFDDQDRQTTLIDRLARDTFDDHKKAA